MRPLVVNIQGKKEPADTMLELCILYRYIILLYHKILIYVEILLANLLVAVLDSGQMQQVLYFKPIRHCFCLAPSLIMIW